MDVISGEFTRRPARVGLVQVSAAGVLWGTGGVVVTLLHERDGLGAMTVSAWRMALAAVALAGFTVLTRRWPTVLAAALAGLVLISVTGHGSVPGHAPGLGLILALAAGATYAATTVLGHTLARRVDPIALTTCATTAGAVALAPFLAVAAARSQPVTGSDPGSLALLVYLGVATMALAYGLLDAGLRTTSGSAATVATLLEPLTAALLAALVLRERLPWPVLLGGALILTAVVALHPAQERPVPA